MERQFKPSLVLGSPFFERSTYLVQTWNTDAVQEFGGFFQNTEFKGFSGKRLVFLKVSHIFTRSANAKGVYSEPDPSEIRSYSERLVTATMTSVASACQALGGVMKDRICEVSSK